MPSFGIPLSLVLKTGILLWRTLFPKVSITNQSWKKIMCILMSGLVDWLWCKFSELRYYELPLSDDTGEHHHKHRKFRGFDTSEHGSREGSILSLGDSDDGSSNPIASSSSTLSTSRAYSSSSLLPFNKRHLATTAKEIMYDQILTKRLNSIVDRNRTLRENLIKKATVYNPKDEWGQEHNFLKQFGRTVSQESVFTPPMPKDRGRGIDSFL